MPKGVAMSVRALYVPISLDWKPYGRLRGPKGDLVYNCMPFFHGTGGLNLVSNLFSGTSVAIGKKFSLKTFWLDCIDSKATMFCYGEFIEITITAQLLNFPVGEVARYLLSAPPSPNDREHNINFMMGNGLRPDVWNRFQVSDFLKVCNVT